QDLSRARERRMYIFRFQVEAGLYRSRNIEIEFIRNNTVEHLYIASSGRADPRHLLQTDRYLHPVAYILIGKDPQPAAAYLRSDIRQRILIRADRYGLNRILPEDQLIGAPHIDLGKSFQVPFFRSGHPVPFDAIRVAGG